MDANVEFWVFLAQFKGDISLLVKDKISKSAPYYLRAWEDW